MHMVTGEKKKGGKKVGIRSDLSVQPKTFFGYAYKLRFIEA